MPANNRIQEYNNKPSEALYTLAGLGTGGFVSVILLVPCPLRAGWHAGNDNSKIFTQWRTREYLTHRRGAMRLVRVHIQGELIPNYFEQCITRHRFKDLFQS